MMQHTQEELDEFETLSKKVLEGIPFCRLLGMEVHHLKDHSVCLTFKNKPELIGNPVQGILHGGVIATALDSVGGLIVMLTTYKNLPHKNVDELVAKFAKTSTIDFRIDYLRTGRGNHFFATASVLRFGNKVCVARMELHNDEDTQIALGTATYLLG